MTKLIRLLFLFALVSTGAYAASCGGVAVNVLNGVPTFDCVGSSSATGTVTSVQISGTTNQITATTCGPSTTTLTCVLSIPSDFRLPGTLNLITFTQPATAATLTIANNKTFTASNTLTLTSSDGSTLAIGGGGTLGSNAYTSTAFAPLASPTFTGTVVIPTPFTLGAVSVTSTGTQLNYLSTATGVTGTASVVLSASPTLTGTITAAAANFSGAVQGASFVATSGDVVTSNLFYKNGASVINLGTDGKVTISNNAQNAGATFDVTTDALIKIETRAGAATADLQIGNIKSSTGQRYVCVDTNGKLVSSAAACVGT